MGLWGPHRVEGTALQPMVSWCCSSVVPAPIKATEIGWVAGDVTMGTGNSEELSHSLMMLRQKICKNMARYFKSQTKGRFLHRRCQEVTRGQILGLFDGMPG